MDPVRTPSDPHERTSIPKLFASIKKLDSLPLFSSKPPGYETHEYTNELMTLINDNLEDVAIALHAYDTGDLNQRRDTRTKIRREAENTHKIQLRVNSTMHSNGDSDDNTMENMIWGVGERQFSYKILMWYAVRILERL